MKDTQLQHDDHFMEEDGVRFAGVHLLLELWGAEQGLSDSEWVLATLQSAAEAAGASVLKTFSHEFSPYGGVTAVVVLAESHISIHTWPERAYAAIDIFMCGDTNPHDAVAVLREAFAPSDLQIKEIRRGLEPSPNTL